MKRLTVPASALALVGAAAVAMAQDHEGLRLKAYLDPVGIPTICYGHTGPEVRLGQTATVAQCDALLAKDLQIAARGVASCAPWDKLNQNQRDALADFTLNVGVPRFCGSTLSKKLRRLDYLGAADEFPKWVYAKGRNGRAIRLPGLVRRRDAERDLFLTRVRTGPQRGSPGNVAHLLAKAS